MRRVLDFLVRILVGLRGALLGPQGLSLVCAVLLAAYWFGGEGALILCGLMIPGILAAATLASGGTALFARVDGLTGLPRIEAAQAALDRVMVAALQGGRAAACFVVELDEFDQFRRIHDPAITREVMVRVAERLRSALREEDIVARHDTASFAVVPASLRYADIEVCIQLASRLQAAVCEAVIVGSARYYVTASVGFVLPRQISSATAASMIEAAECAVTEARQQGPGTIRAFARSDRRPRVIPARLTEDVPAALRDGQIQPWFQPQISTDTGKVTGFEALARWQHPVHGAIAPGEFLPAIAAAGHNDVMSQVMLKGALAAIREWDHAGLEVPSVAINLSEEDLRDPALPDRIRWELDRFELTADRLCIEILESVILPTEDDTITRNIAALAEFGVAIDLDDFGTGTASISAIRRFTVDRIKIDRSFVTRIDRDRSQQDMVAAILSMAERLGLATLAEGVETAGEHAMLAQLGCLAVQGFGISPPLPFDETVEWMRRHDARIAAAPKLERKAM